MANISPEIDLTRAAAAPIAYAEMDPVILIAPDAVVADPDSADLDQGSLVVAITEGASADDQLRIAAGLFAVEETDLYYQGLWVGTVTGGTDGWAPLVVTFNADATPAIAEALIRAIGYVNFSENPVPGERMVTFILADGDGGASTPATATVDVAGTDTAPLAQDDMIATVENSVATGSLFEDNGNGNDSDPDGPALAILEVNGDPANVGRTIVLASGALLTVHADGRYSYDPNGRFDALADASTGAVNSSAADDTFTYTLAGGNLATVTVTVNGVASPGDRLMGDENFNDIRGTGAADLFVLDQGGFDTPTGLGGDDIFYFGAALGLAGLVDGGEGYDTVVLQGDYSGGLELRLPFYGIEAISLLAGSNTAFGGSGQALNSYEIQVLDSHFAAGLRAKINGAALLPGENFHFDATGEKDADFLVYGGRGTDWLRTGAGNDIFFFDIGRFAAGDRVEGGAGYDGLFLRGDYTLDLGGVGFDRALIGIENITLTSATDTRYAKGGGSAFDYDLILGSTLEAGAVLTVSGALLTAEETMAVDGSGSGGSLRLFGGGGGDTLTGGAGADLIHGNLGGDEIRGNGGADLFRYQYTAESSGAAGATDRILDFTPGVDRIDLERIDADTKTAGDQSFTWIGSTAFTGVAGQLRAYDSGPFWIVEGDCDGDGAADLVIALYLQGPTPLGAGDFLP